MTNNSIWNLLVSYLIEDLNNIPHELTFNILEALDHSNDIKKLRIEYANACNSGRREMHVCTIDDAVREVGRVIEVCIDLTKGASEQEKRTWKVQSKVCEQKAKDGCINWLEMQGIRVIGMG